MKKSSITSQRRFRCIRSIPVTICCLWSLTASSPSVAEDTVFTPPKALLHFYYVPKACVYHVLRTANGSMSRRDVGVVCGQAEAIPAALRTAPRYSLTRLTGTGRDWVIYRVPLAYGRRKFSLREGSGATLVAGKLFALIVGRELWLSTQPISPDHIKQLGFELIDKIVAHRVSKQAYLATMVVAPPTINLIATNPQGGVFFAMNRNPQRIAELDAMMRKSFTDAGLDPSDHAKRKTGTVDLVLRGNPTTAQAVASGALAPLVTKVLKL